MRVRKPLANSLPPPQTTSLYVLPSAPVDLPPSPVPEPPQPPPSPVPDPPPSSPVPETRPSVSVDAPAEEVIYAFGVLGMVGPLSKPNSGWMTTDYAAWIFLISRMRGYSNHRSTLRTIRPIDYLFPGGFAAFGDAGFDSLQLPLPSLKTDHSPTISAKDFVSECLLGLLVMAQKVKPKEKFVLLLIGHGDLEDAKFQFLVTTHDEKITAEAFITKHELKVALEPCQGDILVICNSSYSSELVSDRWTLLCSADANQVSKALTQSASGHFRGSAFTACALAQTAREHGFHVPLPCAVGTTGGKWVPLPPSPPCHSLSTPFAKLSVMKPADVSFEELVRRMVDMGRFLVENSIGIFQVKGPNTMVSWTTIFPIDFTAEALGQIGVKVTSADFVEEYNTIMTDTNRQGGPFPTLEPQSLQFDPLLVKLVTAIPDIRPRYNSHDAIYAKQITYLRQRITEPEQYGSPLQADTIGNEDLLVVLRSIHVQALAVQYIARELGWCNAADKVTWFLPQQFESWEFEEMIEKGIRIDKLAGYFKRYHFRGYPYVQHSQLFNSI